MSAFDWKDMSIKISRQVDHGRKRNKLGWGLVAIEHTKSPWRNNNTLALRKKRQEKNIEWTNNDAYENQNKLLVLITLTCGSVTDFGRMENQAFEQLRFSILR